VRTRIKICGITRQQDALEAARLGVDAIGLVFYPPSPRHVSLETARAIADSLPPFVSVVALFVDPEPAFVQDVIRKVHPSVLQFHGAESAAFCEQFGVPYIKALPATEQFDIRATEQRYASAQALLLDTPHPSLHGGTGQVFDWSRFPKSARLPLILAGGLTADNVADAIKHTHAYAVDVSGGVEQQKGIKDPARMAAFVEGVTRGKD